MATCSFFSFVSRIRKHTGRHKYITHYQSMAFTNTDLLVYQASTSVLRWSSEPRSTIHFNRFARLFDKLASVFSASFVSFFMISSVSGGFVARILLQCWDVLPLVDFFALLLVTQSNFIDHSFLKLRSGREITSISAKLIRATSFAELLSLSFLMLFIRGVFSLHSRSEHFY